MTRYLLLGVLLMLMPAAFARAPSAVTVPYPIPDPGAAPLEIQLPGGPVYRVWLEPQYDADNHLTNFELILRRPGDDPEAVRNRLDRSGNWHGYQVYYFAANDFAEGIEKSQFGKVRVVDIEDTGEEVTIEVRFVMVEPVPGAKPADYVFKFLILHVSLDIPR